MNDKDFCGKYARYIRAEIEFINACEELAKEVFISPQWIQKHKNDLYERSLSLETFLKLIPDNE